MDIVRSRLGRAAKEQLVQNLSRRWNSLDIGYNLLGNQQNKSDVRNASYVERE
jgi:hypothetical protein